MYLKITHNVAFDGQEFFPGDFLITNSPRLVELGKAKKSAEAEYKKWLKSKDQAAPEGKEKTKPEGKQ